MTGLRSDVTATESDKAATLMALLIITLLAVHLSQDVVYGYEAARLTILIPLPVAALWLYATVALAGRRSATSCCSDRFSRPSFQLSTCPGVASAR
jgi:hypothetical protein